MDDTNWVIMFHSTISKLKAIPKRKNNVIQIKDTQILMSFGLSTYDGK